MSLDLIQELHGMELHHFVGRLSRISRFGNPSLDDDGTFGTGIVKMRCGDQGRTRDEGRRIDDGLLHVSLDRTEDGSIDDASQHTQSVSSVKIGIAVHVLRETLDDDNDIIVFAGFRNIFDEEIDHSSQGSIVAHKQFSDAKKDFGSFRRGHVLPGVLKVQELSDDSTTLAGIFTDHCWIVKDSACYVVVVVDVDVDIIIVGMLLLDIRFELTILSSDWRELELC